AGFNSACFFCFILLLIRLGAGVSAPPPPPDNFRYCSFLNPAPSPVSAINFGLEIAEGDICGVLVDGARMVTPGILALVRQAVALHPRAIVASVGFHIGPEHQSISVRKGYDQTVEDALLESIDWPAAPYRLFDISTFAGSSPNGWFSPMSESNALFMRRTLWRELGGYEEKFTSPGGGLANLDIFSRACALPETRLIVLLGEGTFHQIHGGVSANSASGKWHEMHSEYVEIRGHAYSIPNIKPLFIGSVNEHCARGVAWSANRVAAYPLHIPPLRD
ncbi:MAG: hypothetical protein LBU43_11280, partial [Candidatus Accumulibacter sp.]|nr:hypothetical protein [Accumulibacter sp.]